MLSTLLPFMFVHVVNPLLAAANSSVEVGQDAGRAIALGVGAGGGAAGAGAGIGMVIESVTRQPEMRDEITSLQWLGFALTEATFFYGLVGGFIAFFL
jgi:F-type H+-transporting ATPase subunit c